MGLWPDTKGAGIDGTSSPAVRIAGFTIGVVLALFYLFQFALSDKPLQGLLSGKPTLDALDWLVIVGAPASVAILTFFAIFSEAPAGATLLMGCFCASLGIALKAGYRVDYYFRWMALIVLPQAAEGALFLAHSRKVFRRKRAKGKKGGR